MGDTPCTLAANSARQLTLPTHQNNSRLAARAPGRRAKQSSHTACTPAANSVQRQHCQSGTTTTGWQLKHPAKVQAQLAAHTVQRTRVCKPSLSCVSQLEQQETSANKQHQTACPWLHPLAWVSPGQTQHPRQTAVLPSSTGHRFSPYNTAAPLITNLGTPHQL